MSATDHAVLLERVLRLTDVREVRITKDPNGVSVGVYFKTDGSTGHFTRPHLCAAITTAYGELRRNKQARLEDLRRDMNVLDDVAGQPESEG